MPMCEKCWSDAFRKSMSACTDQVDEYRKLLAERQNSPCGPRERAGQWWDEEKQRDLREFDALQAKGGEE